MCFRPCQCIVLDEQNMLAVVSYACRGHCILAVQQSENYAKTLENQAKMKILNALYQCIKQSTNEFSNVNFCKWIDS